MDIQQQELQKAIEFVRQTFAEKNQHLDFSPASVKHLDTLFDNEFKNGQLKKADSSFAKFQGLIMTGVSGYIAQVIMKNTGNTQIVINPSDEKWFMSFKLTSASGNFVQPGLRVVKRMLKGEELSLHDYVLFCIPYFLQSPSAQNLSPDSAAFENSHRPANKPWWKFWP
ncbi:MAG: hypothetical protein QM764_03620 [Chitinophagaceae bacterium]